MRRRPAALRHLGLSLAAALAGVSPSVAQSPAPAITVETVPAAHAPDTGKAPAVKPAAVTKKKGEVLPWADKPLAPVAAATGGDQAAAEATAQCGGVFEAACRDLKACAWIADVTLENGTVVPARCVARPPAPPKSAKKTSQPPKKTAKAPAAPAAEGTATAAPAVKASLTRAEDEKPAAAKKEAATQRSEPEAPAPAHKEAAHEEAPHERAAQEEPAPSPQAEAPAPEATPSAAAGKPQEQAENAGETVEAKTPIVVRPPPESEASSIPSFSAASPIIPGADAIVVTVPPPAE